MPSSPQIDIHPTYAHKMLHKVGQDYLAFETPPGMYWPTRLVLGATNSESACVRVSEGSVPAQLGAIAEIFVHNVSVKCPKSQYGDVEVEGMPGVRTFVMEHLQNLDNILADVETAGATISGQKSDWCWNGAKIVGMSVGKKKGGSKRPMLTRCGIGPVVRNGASAEHLLDCAHTIKYGSRSMQYLQAPDSESCERTSSFNGRLTNRKLGQS